VLPLTQKHEIRGSSFNGFLNGRAALVFSPDEAYVVTAPDEKIARVWAVDTGREVARLRHEKTVAAIAYSPDGQLATAGGAVQFWETEFGSESMRLAHDNKAPESHVEALERV
jgi:WD40 repeat protein